MKISHDRIIYGNIFSEINSPEYDDCVLHLVCTGGNGSFRYNDELFTVKVNDIAVITMPSNVTDIEESGNMQCGYIIAPQKFLYSLLPPNNYGILGRVRLFSNPIIPVSDSDAQTFKTDLRAIADRLENGTHLYFQSMISGLIQTMIYDLFDFHARYIGDHTGFIAERPGYLLDRFFSLVNSGIAKTQREPKFYAEELNVSVKYLSDTIKRLTGECLSTHINRAAVSIIIEFLKDNKLSLMQISDEMQFCSPAYFSRYCVKHLGVSPSKFRINKTIKQ